MNFDYYRSFHRFLAVEGDVSKALGSLCGHDLGDVNIDDTPIAGEMALQNFLGDLCGHTRFHEDSVPLPHHPRRENRKVNKISILQTSETRRTETCSRYCDPPSGRAGSLSPKTPSPLFFFFFLPSVCGLLASSSRFPRRAATARLSYLDHVSRPPVTGGPGNLVRRVFVEVGCGGPDACRRLSALLSEALVDIIKVADGQLRRVL